MAEVILNKYIEFSNYYVVEPNAPGAYYPPLPYYYSSPVLTNLSSKFDENLPGRSEFNSDHRVNFSTPRSCLCVTAFCVCPLFFTTKNHHKNHKCGESVSIGVIDQVRRANVDPNALLQINR